MGIMHRVDEGDTTSVAKAKTKTHDHEFTNWSFIVPIRILDFNEGFIFEFASLTFAVKRVFNLHFIGGYRPASMCFLNLSNFLRPVSYT